MIIRDVMPAFELYQPTQLRDAFALLDRFGKDGWKMAGGYDSLSWFKERIKRPKAVIDHTGIEELKGIRETPNGLEIGALTTLTEIERNPVIRAKYRVLADAAVKVASPQIRNHGTLVGNLCAAEPWSDPPCLLAALDARLIIVANRGKHKVSVADWIRGVEQTLRQPDEVLLRIDLPLPRGCRGIGHTRLAARQGLARPLACAAAHVEVSENGNVATARVFVGAVGPRPQRMGEVETMLVGASLGEELFREVQHAVTRSIEYLPDERCGESYKRDVAGVLARRAIAEAVDDARTRRRQCR